LSPQNLATLAHYFHKNPICMHCRGFYLFLSPSGGNSPEKFKCRLRHSFQRGPHVHWLFGENLSGKAKKNMQSCFGIQKCQEFIESKHEHAATSSSSGKTCPTFAPTLVKTNPPNLIL